MLAFACYTCMLGDREIRQSTKSDLGRYWTSFNVAYIKLIPVSREIRIYRSPETNLYFSKSWLKAVFYIVCTYCTTKELIYLFAPYYFFVNPITNKSAWRNAKNERFRRAPPPISSRPIKRLKMQKTHLRVSPQCISCPSPPECWHYFWSTTSDFRNSNRPPQSKMEYLIGWNWYIFLLQNAVHRDF